MITVLNIYCFWLQGLTNSHKSALKSLMLTSVLFYIFLCFSQMYGEITLLLPANQKLSLFFIRKWNDQKSFEPSVLDGPIYCFMISLLLRHLALGRFLESWFPFIEQIYIDNLSQINTFVTDFKKSNENLASNVFPCYMTNQQYIDTQYSSATWLHH